MNYYKPPKVRIEKHLTKQQSAQKAEGKVLRILESNLVWLYDHPESCDKVQDEYKDLEFVMVSKHLEPNVYYIKPFNCSHPVCIVN